MIRGAEHAYPLCLLDTMAVSEMALRPEGLFRHYLEWCHEAPMMYVPCFTVYTVMELRRKPDVFDRFIDRFQDYPCALLKGYMEFMNEEASNYARPEVIDPCAIAFLPAPLGGPGNRLELLPSILSLPEYLEQEREWNKAGPEIVRGMASLVPNYPPERGASYSDAELASFLQMAALPQLVYHGHGQLVERELAVGRAVELDGFPSLEAMTLTVFHKFYADATRKPQESDAFDVLMASALPYVEAFVTEVHQAEAIKKMKRRDRFLDHLEVFTLRDFRAGPPSWTGVHG